MGGVLVHLKFLQSFYLQSATFHKQSKKIRVKKERENLKSKAGLIAIVVVLFLIIIVTAVMLSTSGGGPSEPPIKSNTSASSGQNWRTQRRWAAKGREDRSSEHCSSVCHGCRWYHPALCLESYTVLCKHGLSISGLRRLLLFILGGILTQEVSMRTVTPSWMSVELPNNNGLR